MSFCSIRTHTCRHTLRCTACVYCVSRRRLLSASLPPENPIMPPDSSGGRRVCVSFLLRTTHLVKTAPRSLHHVLMTGAFRWDYRISSGWCWVHEEASGMTLRLLRGSSSVGAMRLEVGMASGKLTAWFVCVCVGEWWITTCEPP